MKKPVYFAGLAPLRSLFHEGVPVICYHKIARKPLRTKSRGIYVSPALFQRQMRELRDDGFQSITLDECEATSSPNDQKHVILTFDDGSVTTLRGAMPALAAAGFTAIQFLVAGLLGGRNEWDIAKGEVPDRLMDEAQARDWLAAGHQIGSHTLSHPHLSQLPLPKAREEISSSKKLLEDRFGLPVRHFCYPYGDFSIPVRDLVAEAGYHTAVTTKPGVWHPGGDQLLIRRVSARADSLNFRNVFRRLAGRGLSKGLL